MKRNRLGQTKLTVCGLISLSGYEVLYSGADGLIAHSRGTFDAKEYRRQLQAGD